MNSLKLKLSDLRKSRHTKKWTSENSSVKPEPGDIFYGDSIGRDALLQKEFEEEQKLKELHKKVKKEGVKPLLFDGEGKPVKRGDKPSYSQESISVLKSVAGRACDFSEIIDAMESIAPPMSRKAIEKSLDIKKGAVPVKGKRAVIGTFNIEWLGTRKREEEDYKQIAQVIKDTGAQVLGIQEISRESGLQRVMKYLPDHGYILGKSGSQKVGIIFDKKRVKYNVNSIDQLDEAVVSTGLRAPLLVEMKIDDGFDFTVTVAHLKAMFDKKSIAKRKKQAKEINKWINGYLKDNKDKDVVILGDFNDFLGSDALNLMSEGSVLHHTTEEVPEDFYSNIPYKGLIDHGSLSAGKGGAMEEFVPGTVRTLDENDYNEFEDRISDHKPVLFDVISDKDND